MPTQSLLLAAIAVLLVVALGYMYWKKRHPPTPAVFMTPVTALWYNLPAPNPSAGGRAVVVTRDKLSPSLVGQQVSVTIALTNAGEPTKSEIASACMPYTGTIAAIDGNSVTLSPTPAVFAAHKGSYAFGVAVSSGGLSVLAA